MGELEISLLGSFRARFNGAEFTENLRTRKERAILAYLAEESRHPQPRERIAEFFWPERPESYARMNLRQALLGIRRSFGSEEIAGQCMVINESMIHLNPVCLELDTWRFSRILEGVKTHTHTSLYECAICIEGLEDAIRQYRGDFLEDMVLGDVLDFQEWLVMHRERYFALVVNAVQLLSEIYFQRAEYQLAHHYAWRFLELAPLEEAPHRLLMRLLALSGRRNAALQQYEACRTIVERELGISPSAETRHLYEQIKNDQPIVFPDTRPVSSDAVQVAYKSPPVELPLYDPATQIPTRPLYVDRVKHALVRMARDQQMAAVAILSIELPTAELLPDVRRQAQQIAIRRITGCLRQADTVALLDSYEFGLLMENIDGPVGFQVVADKLIHSLSAPITLQGRLVRMGAAFGGSVFPLMSTDADELINMADAAMHRARLQKIPYLLLSSS